MEVLEQKVTLKLERAILVLGAKNGNKNGVNLVLSENVVAYSKERNAAGRVIDESDIEARETNIVSIRLIEFFIALAKSNEGRFLLATRGNHIDNLVLAGIVDSTIELTITPYKEGDLYTNNDGDEVPHEHDGNNIAIKFVKLNAKNMARVTAMTGSIDLLSLF